MFWVRDLKIKLNQSDVSKETYVWHKKSHYPSFPSYKLKVTMKYLKTFLALMIINIYIWFVLLLYYTQAFLFNNYHNEFILNE